MSLLHLFEFSLFILKETKHAFFELIVLHLSILYRARQYILFKRFTNCENHYREYKHILSTYFFYVSSPSRELEKDLQGKRSNITPTHPKLATESKEQLERNIKQSSAMEAPPEESKQGMEEPEEKRRLTTDDASPTKTNTDMQTLKQSSNGPLKKSKMVRIFVFDIRYSTFSG